LAECVEVWLVGREGIEAEVLMALREDLDGMRGVAGKQDEGGVKQLLGRDVSPFDGQLFGRDSRIGSQADGLEQRVAPVLATAGVFANLVDPSPGEVIAPTATGIGL
jgi:hypothetical protein